MSEHNTDIRREIKKRRLRQYEVAERLGVNRSTFNIWLNMSELPQERKDQIMLAIQSIEV